MRSRVGIFWRDKIRQTGSCRNSHDHAPGFGHFVGVARAQHDQARNGAQRDQLLHRLVRRAVFADADGIVREDVDHRQFHQRAQADGRAHVVAEDQEARAVGPQLRERHAVDDRSHGVLADAEVEIAAAVVGRARNRPRRRTSGASWWRAPDPPRRRSARARLGDGVQHLARESRLAMPLASAGKTGISLSQPSGSSRCCIWFS